MKKMSSSSTACPCDLGKDYQACCGRWHQGPLALQAPDAPTLMRSRYSAFVLDEIAYLLATWHPDTRPSELEPNASDLKWLGLEVKRSAQTDADHAVVEFVARCRQAGRATRMHETSRFERIDGRWYYLDGEHR
ncbi:YchJ family protein [Bordetella genomosp. 5]|nr:YchJ family metal-binding protein [Bordetella genomosp. 5]